MSIEALNWALTQMQLNDMPTSTRFVLMILANRAAPEGECWPSHQYIQDRTGLSNETVRTACKNLQEAGLLTITPRILESGRKTSNHYQLNLGEGYPQPLGVPTPNQQGEAPPTIGGKTKEVYEGGLRAPISKPEKEGQGQNRPAGPACAKCGGTTQSGTTRMRIGDVCNACREDYMAGKWKLEAAA